MFTYHEELRTQEKDQRDVDAFIDRQQERELLTSIDKEESPYQVMAKAIGYIVVTFVLLIATNIFAIALGA